MKRYGLLLLCFCPLILLQAQKSRLIAGPIMGEVTQTSAQFIMIIENPEADPFQATTSGGVLSDFRMLEWKSIYPIKFSLISLQPGTTYDVNFTTEKGSWEKEVSFTTPPLHQDTVSFLLGSCAFIGTGLQDLVPAGNTKIFRTMADEPSDFMMWLGDNTYYIGNEFNSTQGMMRKQIKVHQDENLDAFLETRPNYAIWDDHDFGPNNSDGTFAGKKDALRVFKHFWPNPAFGLEETPGCFFSFSVGDCDFFMLDDRYYRDGEKFSRLLGKEQMAWLMEGLKKSTATFKFISLGSEVLNEISHHEAWQMYGERQQFFDFADSNHITGIVFLTGDRHFSEVLKLERPGKYPFYDFTCSPLTSWVRKKASIDKESKNPLRVEGTHYLNQNFGKITVSGPANDRKCLMELRDAKGIVIWTVSVNANDLR